MDAVDTKLHKSKIAVPPSRGYIASCCPDVREFGTKSSVSASVLDNCRAFSSLSLLSSSEIFCADYPEISLDGKAVI
jgi:hypothetical protein